MQRMVIFLKNILGCSLHLNGGSSKMNFGPLYSNDNSVGLVIATGNVGKYLANRVDQVNTYLSRDSGLTWFEVYFKFINSR